MKIFLIRRILMSLLLFLTLAAWTVGSAVGSSPDEGHVLTSIWCGEFRISEEQSSRLTQLNDTTNASTIYCKNSFKNREQVLVPTLVGKPQTCFLTQGQNASAKCQQEIVGSEVSVLFNIGPYPQNYPKTLRNLVSADVEVAVIKMRLINAFLASGLLLLAVSLDRRRLDDAFISWLAVISPVGYFFIASVNTSSWTLTGVSCFVFALIAFTKNRLIKKIQVPACLLVASAFWFTNSSRHEGKYFLIALGAAVIFSHAVPTKFVLNKKKCLIGFSLLPFLYLRFLKFSASTPGYVFSGRINIFSDPRFEVDEGVRTSANELLTQNFLNLPRFVMGFFGGWGLGWFELEMTHTVWLFTLQAFLLTTVFSLNKSTLFHRFIFALLTTLMFAAILYANQQTFSKIGEYIQPRYFLPLFLGIVIIAAANKTVRFPNSLVITVAILATISNSIALRDTIRRYTTGQDVFISKSLNNPIEWWWQFGPQPETVWLTGTLAFAGLFAVLIYERNKDHCDNPELPVAELTT